MRRRSFLHTLAALPFAAYLGGFGKPAPTKKPKGSLMPWSVVWGGSGGGAITAQPYTPSGNNIYAFSVTVPPLAVSSDAILVANLVSTAKMPAATHGVVGVWLLKWQSASVPTPTLLQSDFGAETNLFSYVQHSQAKIWWADNEFAAGYGWAFPFAEGGTLWGFFSGFDPNFGPAGIGDSCASISAVVIDGHGPFVGPRFPANLTYAVESVGGAYSLDSTGTTASNDFVMALSNNEVAGQPVVAALGTNGTAAVTLSDVAWTPVPGSTNNFASPNTAASVHTELATADSAGPSSLLPLNAYAWAGAEWWGLQGAILRQPILIRHPRAFVHLFSP